MTTRTLSWGGHPPRGPKTAVDSFLNILLRAFAPGPFLDLPDHILRDIGLSDDARYAITANRDAEKNRLRAQAQGGPFFVPPA